MIFQYLLPAWSSDARSSPKFVFEWEIRTFSIVVSIGQLQESYQMCNMYCQNNLVVSPHYET